MNTERAIFIFLRVISSVMLLWGLLRHQIDYYSGLRFVVSCSCAYGVYLAIKWQQVTWAFIFGALALLFNPLKPLLIKRETWFYIDISVAAFLILTIFFFHQKRQVGEPASS
jgi:hypothetical protein